MPSTLGIDEYGIVAVKVGTFTLHFQNAPTNITAIVVVDQHVLGVSLCLLDEGQFCRRGRDSMIWTGTRGSGGNIAQAVCAIHDTRSCVVGIPIHSPVAGSIVARCEVSSLQQTKLLVCYISKEVRPVSLGCKIGGNENAHLVQTTCTIIPKAKSSVIHARPMDGDWSKEIIMDI